LLIPFIILNYLQISDEREEDRKKSGKRKCDQYVDRLEKEKKLKLITKCNKEGS
jgi:hypothetical protein